jgi:glycosyltransferase involved in cell wall biosynthesis
MREVIVQEMKNTTVVLSVLNGEKYLKRCIESVLRQSMADFEFIIVDDGSTDGTPGIIKGYLADERVRVITHVGNKGISKSLNDALEDSKGEYVSFIEHDDWWVEDKLALERDFLRQEGVGVVYSSYYLVKGAEIKPVDLSGEDIANIRKGRNFMNMCSLTVGKKCLDLLRENDGHFMDESLTSAWDGDLVCRLVGSCRFKYLERYLAYKQTHPEQLSRRWVHQRDRVRVAARYNKNPLSLMWNLYGIPLIRRIKNQIK